MNHEIENSQKFSTFYRSSDSIDNFKIRVELIEISDDLQSDYEKVEETEIFSWQEKAFGNFERQFYKDLKNCLTDLDKKYHDAVVQLDSKISILFTYVNRDEYNLHDENCVYNNSKATTNLCNKILNMRLSNDDDDSGASSTKTSDVFNFRESLANSLNDPYGGSCTNFEVMHVMADLGEFMGEAWIKSERNLCTIKYDRAKKCLLMFPDFTQMEQAYYFEIDSDPKRTFKYFIRDASEKIPLDVLMKESEILKKINAHEKKLRLQKIGHDFETPIKSKLNVYLFCEILGARNFENNDIYVQYFIDLPDNWICKNVDSLKGTTLTSHSTHDDNLFFFGFPFEISLEYNLQDLEKTGIPKGPHIYFEIISKGSWDRFRTEGLTYAILPVSQPGAYNYKLQCLRICSRGPGGNLRRFFIGDCSNYADLSWISLPKDYDKPMVNKFGVDTVGTGEIDFRVNVVHQSQVLTNVRNSDKREEFILEKLNASGFAKNVEQVIEAFQLAKRKMIEARKNV